MCFLAFLVLNAMGGNNCQTVFVKYSNILNPIKNSIDARVNKKEGSGNTSTADGTLFDAHWCKGVE